MARQVEGAWFGADCELPEPTLDEALRFCADMATLGDDDPPSAYEDDPRVLYRSGEVLE